MPKSKRDSSRIKNLINYKQKHKKKQMSNQNQFQLPPTRNFPVWKSNAKLTIMGTELEAISQFMETGNYANAAYQNVINRGLIEGTIELRYEKLNKEGTAYEPMTDEESKEQREQFEKLVKEAKEIAEQAKSPQPPSQEGLPHLDAIVDPTGQPATKEIVTEESKIITL